MSRNITPVSNTDSFEDWIEATNTVIEAFLDTVTVSTANGDTTSGNGFIIGTFGANVIVASTLRGGNVTSSGKITVTSNAEFTSESILVNGSTVNVVTSSFSLSTNSLIKSLEVSNDGNSTVTSITGNTLIIGANVLSNSSILRIPVGTTASRPVGSNGYIRYNTNTELLEYFSNSSWVTVLSSSSGNVVANSVTFTPNANVTSNNVQAAITEVFDKKAAKTGDTFTGNVVVNTSGAEPVAAPSGGFLHISGPDSAPTSAVLDAVGASPRFVGRRSQGTNASRTKVLNGTTLVALVGSGHNGTGVVEDKGSVEIASSQDWFTANNGTQLIVKTTPTSSNTSVNTMVMSASSTVINTSSLGLTGSLTVGGSIVANGNITAFSDRRLKQDIETIEDALSTVAKLRGVTYRRDGVRNQGVVAQEVAEVIPEVVTEVDGYLSVAYGNLVGVLIEAIKELTEKVETLEKTVDDIRG